MKNEWKQVALGNVAEINPARTLKKGMITPFIPMNALSAHTRSPARIDKRTFIGQGVKFQNGDTLLARITPCLENGKTVFVSGLPEMCVAHGSTEYIVMSGKTGIADSLFIYYLSRSNDFRNHAITHMEGTSGRQRVPNDVVEKYSLPLPPLPEQKTIARILGTLDDKIELNRRMNATLEAMACALFQSWFVDFAPVHQNINLARSRGDGAEGKNSAFSAPPREPFDSLFPNSFSSTDMPKGRRLGTVGELCEINEWMLSKKDELDELEYVEISEVSRGDIANISTYTHGDEPSRARRRLRHGDTALSNVRPDRGSYFLALNPPMHRVASTGFAVVTPTKAPWSFVHVALTQPEIFERLGQLADGGAYPAIHPEVIGDIKILIPEHPEVLTAFHQTCVPLLEQAEANRTQFRTLATLRDTQLPRLLSGELSLSSKN